MNVIRLRVRPAGNTCAPCICANRVGRVLRDCDNRCFPCRFERARYRCTMLCFHARLMTRRSVTSRTNKDESFARSSVYTVRHPATVRCRHIPLTDKPDTTGTRPGELAASGQRCYKAFPHEPHVRHRLSLLHCSNVNILYPHDFKQC